MRLTLRSAAAAACLLAAAVNLSSLAHARTGREDGSDCRPLPGEGAWNGAPMGGQPHAPGMGPWGHHPASLAGPALPPWMHRLDLSEAQQDKVFTILHEQEPTLRDRFKAVHGSREALRRASLNASADPTQLRTLADAAGHADAELALLMAQTDQRLLQVLTPEQSKVLQDCLPK